MLKMEARVKIEDKAKDLITYKDFPVSELKFKSCVKPSGGEDDVIPKELEDLND